jgi:hypothetical protein
MTSCELWLETPLFASPCLIHLDQRFRFRITAPTHTCTTQVIMSSQAQLKTLANAFIPTFLLSTGLLGLLFPTTMAALFGMPIQADTFAAGFVQCMGGRNLTFGIIASIFLQRGDRKAVATMATLLAVDGCVDGWVCWRYSGIVAAAPHFGAAAVIPFVSAWMAS